MGLAPDLALAVQHWAQCAAALSRATELLQRQMAASGIDSPGRFAERRGAFGDVISEALNVNTHDTKAVLDVIRSEAHEVTAAELLGRLEQDMYSSGGKLSEQSQCVHSKESSSSSASVTKREAQLSSSSKRRRRQSAPCYFKTIPDDILENVILGFIPKQRLYLRCVSKRWSAAVLNAIGLQGSLMLRPRCALPPEGYRGALELNLTTNCTHFDLGADAIHYLDTYRNVSALYLTGSFREEGEVGAFCKALSTKTYVINVLGLGFNSLQSNDAEYLSNMLRTQSNIRKLNLEGTNIGKKDAQGIYDALLYNNTIETLYLSGNNIDEEYMGVLSNFLLKNTSLTQLMLGDNKMYDEGVALLAKGLEGNATLQYLDLSRNEIANAGASLLASALRVNSTLKTLYLSRNSIRDDGASTLFDMLRINTSLTELNFAANSISYVGCDALVAMVRVNSTLKSLNLSENNLGYFGMEDIANGLCVNKGLTDLDLSECGIHKNSCKILRDALCANTVLKKIYFRGKDNEDNCAYDLADYLGTKGASARIYLDDDEIAPALGIDDSWHSESEAQANE